MLGAIIGDIVGSYYESFNYKGTDFLFLHDYCEFTDDTVMTLAVAKWLREDPGLSPQALVRCMKELGCAHLTAGFGGTFYFWLQQPLPKMVPYGRWGNGAGMRVSPVGMCASSMEECLDLARISAGVSHDHPEGIKGAQAIASAVYIARTSENVFSVGTKRKVKSFVESRFGYDLGFTLDEIRPRYRFDVSCQGSCPQAIRAYLEGRDFEEVVRLAVSVGGDSDTIACMAGGIAGAQFDIPEVIARHARKYLSEDLRAEMDRFEKWLGEGAGGRLAPREGQEG